MTNDKHPWLIDEPEPPFFNEMEKLLLQALKKEIKMIDYTIERINGYIFLEDKKWE